MTERESDEPDGRPDLAAMVAPLARRLIAAEEPVLQAHDLSMWGYVVLLALAREPVRTQAALAQAIGADKTRIIAVLDELQDRGLIERRPDPADRRGRTLSLTPAGRRVRSSAQAGIRATEATLLAQFSEPERRVFLDVLRRLAAQPG